MKAILFTLITMISAQAASLHPDTYAKVAELTKFVHIHEESDLSDKTLAAGKIFVNEVRKNIRLELTVGLQCTDMRPCPEIAYKKIVELPLVASYTSRCGITVYEASRDLRPVDGELEVLRVSDYSKSFCMGIVHSDLVQIEHEVSFYDRLHGEYVFIRDVFSANIFE